MKFINKKLFVLFVLLTVLLTSCVPDPISCNRDGDVIGVVAVDLDLRGQFIRKQEAPIGNYIADAVLDFINNDNLSIERLKANFNEESNNDFKVDFAIVNSGAIRHCASSAMIKSGSDFTTGMIDELLPFPSNIYVVKLTGGELIEIFEHSVAKIEETKGQFLQVSKGVRVIYDKNKDPEILNKVGEKEYEVTFKGERVKELYIDDIRVDVAGDYYVATSGYVATGGDQFVTFSLISDNKKLDMINTYNKALSDYIKINNKIDPKIEGRITYLSE